MRIRISELTIALMLALGLGVSSSAQKSRPAEPTHGEDFFIVSSVDAEKKRLLLKHPTEVTEMVLVNDKTVYLNEQGKPLRFGDFRAGDTIYVSSSPQTGQSARVAVRIRKGAMTLEELRRRYVKNGNGPREKKEEGEEEER